MSTQPVESSAFAIRIARNASETTRAWWAVVSRFLLHGLIVSTWVSRIPAVQTALHLSNASLGLCLLGTAIGSVVAIPATGWLVTKFGSKRITAWSTVAFALALFGPSLAVNGLTLFTTLLAFGAAAGMNDVSINAQGVAIEKAMGSPTMSRFHAMFSIGGMVGASIGGVIAAQTVAPVTHMGLASVLFVAIALLTGPYLFNARDNVKKQGESFQLRNVPGVLFTLALIGFCLFLSEGAIADWTGVYLKQVLNANQSVAAAGYATFSTGMAVFRLLGDAITKRLGPVLTIRIGAVLAAAGLSLALTAHSVDLALVGFALTGSGFSAIIPLVFAAGGRLKGFEGGAGIALVSGCGYIGFLFGPPLIGLIAQASTLRIALFLLVALSLTAAVLANAAAGDEKSRSTS